MLLIKRYHFIINFKIGTHLRCQFSFVPKVLPGLIFIKRVIVYRRGGTQSTPSDIAGYFPPRIKTIG